MRFVVLLCTLLLCACAITSINTQYSKTLSSWRFAKANALLQNWGKPSKIATLPNGNRVFIYYKEAYKNYPPPSITSTFATVSIAGGRSFIVVPSSPELEPGPAYLIECTTFFEVDPRNIIVDIRANGRNCTADNGFMLSRSNPHPVGPT